MATKDFNSRFKKILTEDQSTEEFDINNDGEVSAEEVIDTSEDAKNWKDSLDSGTDPKTFDAAKNPFLKISKQNIDIAKEWIAKIDRFKSFINDLAPDSLFVQINKMDREGSVFKGIVRSEKKKIIKIAEALGSFNEILKSYVIGADRRARELNVAAEQAKIKLNASVVKP